MNLSLGLLMLQECCHLVRDSLLMETTCWGRVTIFAIELATQRYCILYPTHLTTLTFTRCPKLLYSMI